MSPVASETRAASLSMIRSILQKRECRFRGGKLDSAVTALRTVIGARPEEAGKFGKIKLSNAKVQERIVKVPGAIDILEVGFCLLATVSPPLSHASLCIIHLVHYGQAAHFVVISLPVETGELEDYLVFQADSLRCESRTPSMR